jgi:hypothetical protein
MEQNEQTHDIFFKTITRKKLNELLLRADKKILQNHINKELIDEYSIVYVKKNQSSECSIYIDYYDKKTKNKLGYISLHFYPQQRNRKTSKAGRIHVRNSKNNPYTLRFNKDTNDELIISLTKYSDTMSSSLKKAVNKTLILINLYFNEKSPYWLGNPSFKDIWHPCFYVICNSMKRARKNIRNTRKTQKSYSIPRSSNTTTLKQSGQVE